MQLHIQPDFECVFFINGEFFERAESLTVGEFDVVYVTALPLKPTLLPYTVKLNGAESIAGELAFGTRLERDDYILCLSPRYAVIYGTPPKPVRTSPVARLFGHIKDGEIADAYAMLSPELKSKIDKAALSAFFDGYERLIERRWDAQNKNRFYLLDKNGCAKPHSYTVVNGFIDDIVEE